MFNMGPSQGFLQRFLQQQNPDAAQADPESGERNPMAVMRPQVIRPQLPTFLPGMGVEDSTPGGPQHMKRPSIFGMFGGDTSQRMKALQGMMGGINSRGGIFGSYGSGPNSTGAQPPSNRLRLF